MSLLRSNEQSRADVPEEHQQQQITGTLSSEEATTGALTFANSISSSFLGSAGMVSSTEVNCSAIGAEVAPYLVEHFRQRLTGDQATRSLWASCSWILNRFSRRFGTPISR